MRLFIALELPEEVKEELLKVQKLLPEAKMRPVGKEQMHLTLKFLGEVTPEKAERVKECLKKVELKPFRTCLSKIGVFPSESYIRVVWVGLEPEQEIVELQKAIDSSLEKDFPKDKQFKAHLTLARVKFVKDKKAFVEGVKKIKATPISFDVKDFRLKKSTLMLTGPIYEDVAVF